MRSTADKWLALICLALSPLRLMVILQELAERVYSRVDTAENGVEDSSHRILLIDGSLPILALENTLGRLVRILVLKHTHKHTHTHEQKSVLSMGLRIALKIAVVSALLAPY